MRTMVQSPMPPVPDSMANTMSYPPPSVYMSAAYYHPPAHGSSHPPSHVHVVAPQPRAESQQQRKRPKYTRSKTGCLTCRVKKIKCDETKPTCMRCSHGQRDCTWPEGVPARKKSTSRKDSLDGRPSTAESSGISEASTPPTRDNTPPRRSHVDYTLPPLNRRHSEPYPPLQHLPSESAAARRSIPTHGYAPQNHSQNSNVPNSLSMIPESSAYPSHSRFDTPYTNVHTPVHANVSSRLIPASHQSVAVRPIGNPIPSASQWNNTPLISSVDPMSSYFHSVQERNLIRHYCDHSMSILMAIPSENPIVAANLPLVLNRPPGSDSSAEALRMALLGVSAIHQSFLLARSGVTQGQAEEMLQLAYSFRMNSKQLLAKACATAEGAQSDASLAASLSIALMDILSGGRNWLKNMELAKTLVRVRGGPFALLARKMKANSSGDSSAMRLLLETLAMYDIAACIANGQEPTVLNATSDSWWLDESHCGYSYVEQVFGVSRSFVPLLAKVTSFISRALQGTARISEVTGDAGSSVDEDLAAECRELYNQLDTWMDTRPDVPRRVAVGNLVYQKATQLLLLSDILHTPLDDQLVQSCVDTILSLCMECTSSNMGVDLILPVIIAGCHSFGDNRTLVADIFNAFRTQCCYEVDTSEQIVLQVWQRQNHGAPGADWRSVMKDLDLSVLII